MVVSESDLVKAGYTRSLAELQKLVDREYHTFMERRSPRMKPQEFILRPALAMEFVDKVRDSNRLPLADHLILGVLLMNGKHKGV